MSHEKTAAPAAPALVRRIALVTACVTRRCRQTENPEEFSCTARNFFLCPGAEARGPRAPSHGGRDIHASHKKHHAIPVRMLALAHGGPLFLGPFREAVTRDEQTARHARRRSNKN